MFFQNRKRLLYRLTVSLLSLLTLSSAISRSVLSQNTPIMMTQITPQDLYDRAFDKAKNGLHNEAIADFTTAISMKNDFAEAYFARGSAKILKGDDSGAINDLRISASLYRQRGDLVREKQTLDAIASIEEDIRLERLRL